MTVSEQDFEGLPSLDEPEPEVWKPDVGDELWGRLVSRRTADGKYGPVDVLLFDTARPGGMYEVWPSAAVLRRKLTEEVQLRPGDLVKIRRLPDGTSKNGSSSFKDFKVATNASAAPSPAAAKAAAERAAAYEDPWAGEYPPEAPYSDEPPF